MTSLPEITSPNVHDARALPNFPGHCPACGSQRIWSHFSDFPSCCEAAYGCGARYTYKSQIQNHTNKWWGQCPKGGAL